jgi:hypothetical protein
VLPDAPEGSALVLAIATVPRVYWVSLGGGSTTE